MRLTIFKTRRDRERMAGAFDRFLKTLEEDKERRVAAEIAALHSPADVRAYQRRVRGCLAEVLGDLPERTPLNPRMTGRLTVPGATVEKIILESRPRYYVTANLYIPRGRQLPAPGILVPCGHLDAGKTGEYGDAALGLARMGYVSLVFDPTGQGERSECIDPRTGRQLVTMSVGHHHWTGKPCRLTGTTLAGYRVWDGIRCLDYLLSRPEVDPRRIGVMGNSGGGAMTILITAVDKRVVACVPSHPGGSCENTLLRGYWPPAREILCLLAPRPCRIIVGNRSGEELYHAGTIKLLKPFYAAYGCPERLELVLVDGYHDLFKPKREVSYEWLNRWLGRADESNAEPPFHRIAARRLWCTKTGQVQTSLGGATMASINRTRADQIAPRRTPPATATELRKQQASLRHALKTRLAFQRVTGPLNVRVISKSYSPPPATERRGSNDHGLVLRFLSTLSAPIGDRPAAFDIERLVFESEPGMPVPALFFTPEMPRPEAPVVVHVSEDGKPQTLEARTLPIRLARAGFRVLALDVRDTGEGALCQSPRFPFRFRRRLTAYDPDLWRREMLAIRALGVGRSRSGMRVLDIIRAGDLLSERNLCGYGYAVVGEGRLGIEALKAAALDKRAVAAAAVRTLVSYRMITDHAYYNQYQHFWTSGALKDYDIPDLPVLIAPRPVAFIAPVDHLTRPVGAAELRRRFA